MNKKNKIILAFSIILLFSVSSFVPAVLGWGGHRRTTFRPITDWTDINPFGIGPEWYVGYCGGNDENLYWMWIDSLMSHFFYFNFETFEPLTEYVYEFEGYVKEKVLRDGSLEYTIRLKAFDIFVEVNEANYDENGDPIWTMNHFGDHGQMVANCYVNYYFELKFVLSREFNGFTGTIIPHPLWPYEFDIPGGTREKGCDLPPSWAFFFFPEELGIQVKSLKLMAFGSGVVMEPGWFYPTPPETEYPPGPFEAGTTDLFFFFNARFKDGETMLWPHGPFGYRANYITLLNTEYY